MDFTIISITPGVGWMLMMNKNSKSRNSVKSSMKICHGPHFWLLLCVIVELNELRASKMKLSSTIFEELFDDYQKILPFSVKILVKNLKNEAK
jgi:hypothetical protein